MRNPIARDLRTPKYRQRIIPSKRAIVDPLADGLRDVFNERLSPDKERAVNAELDRVLRSK